jgi:hypothetical protein
MKEPKNTHAHVVLINNMKVAIKARRDDDDMNPSGWSIIAFTPSASIRCVRAHQPKHLDLFVKGVIALTGGDAGPRLPSSSYQIDLTEIVHDITGGVFL